MTDIALPTFPDEQSLHGDASPETTADRLSAAGVREIVVKNGELPATVRYQGKTETVAAVHVASPVDTTGAGDSFNGSYLAARLEGLSPTEATRKAHAVAAAVVHETLRAAFAA